MMSLSRNSGLCHVQSRTKHPSPFRGCVLVRPARRSYKTATTATALATAGAVQPACTTLLGLTGDSVLPLLELSTSRDQGLSDLKAACKALQNDYCGPAQLVGAAAAGTWLPSTPAVIAVPLPDKNPNPTQAWASLLTCMQKDQRFSGIPSDMTGLTDCVQRSALHCKYGQLDLIVMVCSPDAAGVLQLLNPQLSAEERLTLSTSTMLVRTAFLQTQPDLFRAAATVVKQWAQQVTANWKVEEEDINRPKKKGDAEGEGEDRKMEEAAEKEQEEGEEGEEEQEQEEEEQAEEEQEQEGEEQAEEEEEEEEEKEQEGGEMPSAEDDNVNRSFGYLLDLLVWKAYQNYINSAAKDTLSSRHSTLDDSAATEAILYGFLKLVRGLDKDSCIAWEWRYEQDVAEQVAASEALAQVLRPDGCEEVPLVLDPADPTNNVAAVLDNKKWNLLVTAANQALRNIAVNEEKVACAVQAHRAASMAPTADWTSLPQYQAAVTLQDNWLAPGWGYWKLEAKDVSNWVPAADGCAAGTAPRQVVTVNDRNIPELKIRMLANPMHLKWPASDYSTGMGIELRLDSENCHWMKVLETLNVPFPVTLKKDSSITVSRPSSAPRGMNGAFQVTDDDDINTIYLEQDITGFLGTEKGLIWEPTRLQWYQLGLCDIGGGVVDELRILKAQAEAGCELSFELHMSFTKPSDHADGKGDGKGDV